MQATEIAPRRKDPTVTSRPAPRLPQIIQLVHDRHYYVLPQTPLQFLASKACDLSAGQIRLFLFLVTNSWAYGRLFVGSKRKTKLGQDYWDPMSQADMAQLMEEDFTRLNHDLAALEEVSLAYTDDQGRIYPWAFPIPSGETASNLGESAKYFQASPLFPIAVSLETAYRAQKEAAYEAHIAPLKARYHEGLKRIKSFAKEKPEAVEELQNELGDFAKFFELSPLPQLGETAKFSLADPPSPSIRNARVEVEHAEQRKHGTPSSSVVLHALAAYGQVDDDAVKTLFTNCLRRAPEAEYADIVHFINLKGPLSAGKKNPIGFLLTAVPRCFEGEAFEAYRKKKAIEAELLAAGEARQARELAQTYQDCQRVLDDPTSSEEDKALALEVLEAI